MLLALYDLLHYYSQQHRNGTFTDEHEHPLGHKNATAACLLLFLF